MTKPKACLEAAKRRPGLIKGLAAAVLLALAAAAYHHYSPFLTIDDNWFLSEAEAFYHGLGPAAALDSMPLTGFYYSLLAHNFSPLWLKFFLAFSVLSLSFTAFALGSALCSPLCGALGSAIMLYSFLSIKTMVNWGRYFETSVFTLLTGLIALFLLYYRSSGKKRDAVFLGVLLGCSLLCRSTFFLFPFCLLAVPLFRRKEAGPDWRSALFAVLIPYLMLAPWWLMKWRLYHEFTLFEAFRAKANIITGLLGFVNTINGGYQEALSLAHINASTDLWAWGAGQLRSNFAGIAAAVGLRLWKVLTYGPLLSVLALCGILIGRLDEKVRTAAALVLYFVGIHLLMPVEDRYFIPLLPILAALAARGAAPLCGGACPAGSGRAARYASYSLALLLACGPLALYAHTRLYSANIRSGDEAAVLKREAAAYPGDPWLLERTNELSLRRYLPIDSAGTERHLQEPGAGQLRFQYALNEAVHRQQTPRLQFTERPDPEFENRLAPLIFLHDLEKKDRAAARTRFGEYQGACKAGRQARFRETDIKTERASLENYEGGAGELCPREFTVAAAGLLEYYPPGRALALARELCAEDPSSAGQLLPLALYWQNGKRYRESLELLELLLRYRPENAELWSDKGMQELFLERRQAAIADFRRAIKLSPGLIPAYINLGAALEMSAADRAAAGEVYTRALAALTPAYGALRPLLLKKTGAASHI